MLVFSALEISLSLAPPPLDQSLSVAERLNHVQLCLQKKPRKKRSLIMYDFIQHYKTLLMACGISLEGNFEDPKVCRIKNFFLGKTASLNTTVERQEYLLVLLLFRYEYVHLSGALVNFFFSGQCKTVFRGHLLCYVCSWCLQEKQTVSEVNTLLFHTLLGRGNEDKSLPSPGRQDLTPVLLQ